MQTTLLKPHFLLVGQVSRHRGKGDRQIFDIHFTDDFPDPTENPLPPDRTQIAKAHIQQTQHIQIGQARHPLTVGGQATRRINTAYYGAHGAAGNAVDGITPALYLFNDTNMGIASGAPTTEHQCNTLGHVSSWKNNPD